MDIQTDDFYKDMCENIHMYDTSDYPYPNVYNMPLKNKKVPGLFKDELKGKVMTQAYLSNMGCSLCLEPYGNQKIIIFQCGHLFHSSCGGED